MHTQVDHLVFTCSDLDAGIEHMENKLGVRPAIGGRHPAWGTHNALIGLGGRRYLEVIAPDPDASVPPRARPESFTAEGALCLKTWAAAASELPDLCARAAAIGVQLGERAHGSRMRPDGVELSWSLTNPACFLFNGVVPFLIDWGRSPHPGEQAPEGCALLELRLAHPEHARVKEVLSALGYETEVEHAEHAGLVAVIESPRGRVELH